VNHSAWVVFEEAFISCLQSGLGIVDAFRLSAEFPIEGVTPKIEALLAEIDSTSNLETSIRNFGRSFKDAKVDLFVEIVILCHGTGSQNLVSSLQNHVRAVRHEIKALGDVKARTGAILGVAKLGLFAPWLLVLMLCFNEANRSAYFSLTGFLILSAVFVTTLIAYRWVYLLGRQKSLQSSFGGNR